MILNDAECVNGPHPLPVFVTGSVDAYAEGLSVLFGHGGARALAGIDDSVPEGAL